MNRVREQVRRQDPEQFKRSCWYTGALAKMRGEWGARRPPRLGPVPGFRQRPVKRSLW